MQLEHCGTLSTTMFDINRRFIVLSHGRSASAMLAQRIGIHLGSFGTKFVKTPNELLPLYPIQHTHLVYTPSDLLSFCRVYSLRRDPVQTILSGLFVNQFKVYHKVTDANKNTMYHYNGRQTTDLHLDPFVFDRWYNCKLLCNRYCAWHRHYSSQLSSDDYVVFYEDILQHVENASTNHLLLYGNKEKILLNYNEVVEYIELHFKEIMLDSQRIYTNHCNNADIYKFLSKPI
jgi:hypothetical protein